MSQTCKSCGRDYSIIIQPALTEMLCIHCWNYWCTFENWLEFMGAYPKRIKTIMRLRHTFLTALARCV